MKSPWRVDSTATGPDGHPVPGLTAADFEIRTDGRLQKVTAADFQSAGPLHIALLVDDLSLSPDNLALLQKALHAFVAGRMRPGDEVAILSTSASNGRADQFTPDKSPLDAAIDRLRSNRPADDSPLAFRVGAMGALRSALLGLQFTPGRKLAILLSERLRDRDRTPDPTWVSRLLVSANRSSAVFYAVDVTSNIDPSYVLEQGLGAAAAQTGGALFDAGGDPGAVLGRILESQQGYYILRFETEPLQRTTPLTVRTERQGIQVRARNGVLGLAGDADGIGFVAPEDDLRAAIASTLFATDLSLGLTPELIAGAGPYVKLVLHVNSRDVTLTLEADGDYHGALEATAALFQENDASVSQASRVATLRLTAKERQETLESGFDLALRLPAPKKGPYQLRAAVLDTAGGRLGAASRFFEARDLTLPALTIGPIRLEPVGDPPRPVYPSGEPVRYSYDLSNLRNNGADHAKVEVTNRLLRDGKVIYAGEPKILDVGLAPQQSGARISGAVRLGAEVQPGKFTLSVTALDTLATGTERRSATQTVEFEIQN